MTAQSGKYQRGIALLALLAVIALSASWFLVSRLNRDSNAAVAANRNRNAIILNRAKQALVGYVAMDATDSAEQNPGRLPCPEAPGSFDNSSTEGTAAGTCSLPVVGRFPWRTLGLDKLVDISGEPLWYVVAPGWAYSGSNLTINSNCASAASGMTCATSQLTVDGAANGAVALIIAPGPAFSVPAAAGCAAWNQTRPTSGTPDWRNYLECDNATNPADSSFVTTGPSGSFNDQVLRVTVADLMPGIEAAIADRISKQIVPALQGVYAGASWGLGGTSRKYPFAAPFANPSTSAMQGAAGTLQGLIPMNHAETSPFSGTLCTAGSDARCAPNFVAWSSASMSGASTYSESCTHTATNINCSFYYQVCVVPFFCGTTTTVPFTVSATATNVGMALRQLNGSTAQMTNVSSINSLSATLNADGSATLPITGNASVSSSANGLLAQSVCGILGGFASFLFGCNQGSISIPITVFADHSLLDSNNATTGWFVRNKWHELSYYALAAGYAPSGTAACTTMPGTGTGTGTSCFSITNVTPSGAQRAILVLAGRAVNGNARPSASLADYLEFGNNTGNFEQRSISRPISTVYADTGGANAYSINATATLVGQPLQFMATAANTGGSTLATAATGAKALRNTDGSSLTAGEIQANAVVEAAFDGTQFLLFKRPFNDRVVVIDSN